MEKSEKTVVGKQQSLHIPAGDVILEGDLYLPSGWTGLVVFAHGSGSSRLSPRNTYVAQVLREAGLGTLLFDLLTRKEEIEDEWNGIFRFNIRLLAQRLIQISNWLIKNPETSFYKIGYFGASTGAAAALIAAAELRRFVRAVVSRGGRPDMAEASLSRVKAPTLLIVGGDDVEVIRLNQEAYDILKTEKKLEIIPGATHLFEEPGALEMVASLASNWFVNYLGKNNVWNGEH